MSERDAARVSFDEVALLYQQVRPGYPEALFAEVLSYAAIPRGGHILEIGCGTGQATLPLARRGYLITCVELGEQLAAVARRQLAAYPDVEIYVGAFEEWPVAEAAFDLAISATAFHWIDPSIGYPKVACALKPRGALALFWNKHIQPDTGDAFFSEVQECYLREAPELVRSARPLPRAAEIETPVAADIERSGLFGPVDVRRYHWRVTYDALGYRGLLETYSDHRRLDPTKRERLLVSITELIESRYGGHVTKDYLSLLYLARRR